MNLRQPLRRRESGKSGASPEEDRCHSGRRRRGASAAAGSDWSLHSAKEELLEQRASEKPRTDTVNYQKLEVTVETLIMLMSYQSI